MTVATPAPRLQGVGEKGQTLTADRALVMSLWAVNLSVTDQCDVDAHLAATRALPLARWAYKWGWSCNNHTHTHTCARTHTHKHTHTHITHRVLFWIGSSMTKKEHKPQKRRAMFAVCTHRGTVPHTHLNMDNM